MEEDELVNRSKWMTVRGHLNSSSNSPSVIVQSSLQTVCVSHFNSESPSWSLGFSCPWVIIIFPLINPSQLLILRPFSDDDGDTSSARQSLLLQTNDDV